jgi:hypothetical protein
MMLTRLMMVCDIHVTTNERKEQNITKPVLWRYERLTKSQNFVAGDWCSSCMYLVVLVIFNDSECVPCFFK